MKIRLFMLASSLLLSLPTVQAETYNCQFGGMLRQQSTPCSGGSRAVEVIRTGPYRSTELDSASEKLPAMQATEASTSRRNNVQVTVSKKKD